MRSRAPAWLWPGAVLVGLVLGVVGFLLVPLEPSFLARPAPGPSIGSGRSSATGTPSPPGATPSGPPTSTPSATGSAAESPPFTRLALLQAAEFLDYGWGRSEQTALYDGAGADLPTVCAAPRRIVADSAESYSGRYRGLQTDGIELVARYPDAASAAAAYDRLVEAIAGCDDASRKRRADPVTRHDPKPADGLDAARGGALTFRRARRAGTRRRMLWSGWPGSTTGWCFCS